MKKWHGVTKVACDHIIWRGHPRQGSDAINDHKKHTKKPSTENVSKNFGAKNWVIMFLSDELSGNGAST